MGVMQTLRNWFASPYDSAIMDRSAYSDLEVRQNIGTIVVPPYQLNKPIWTTGDPARYVDEGWNKAPVVFACVMAIGDAAATAPIRVLEDRGGDEPEPVPDSALAALMRRPNLDMDGAEFVAVVVDIAAISGFCVIEKERDRLGNVIGLWPLRSDWLKPIPREQSAPAWAYYIPGHRDPFIKEPEDVIVHTHAPDPSLGYRGTSPLAVAFRELGIENLMTDFLKAFFDRGALPVYGIIPKSPIGDQAQADAFRERIIGKYGGALKSAEPMVLAGVEDVKRLGFDFDELAYPELRALAETQICTAFRVPPILVGIQEGLEHGTYSNYEQARKAFYEETVVSLWRRLDGALTRGLLPEFDSTGRLSIVFDKGEVPALQDDENERWQRSTAALSAGGISTHVYHRQIGIKPHGPDVFLRPFNVVEVPVASATGTNGQRGAMIELYTVPPETYVIPSNGHKAIAEPRIVTRDGHRYLNLRALPTEERARIDTAITVQRRSIDQLARLLEPKVSACLSAQAGRIVQAVTEERAAVHAMTLTESIGPEWVEMKRNRAQELSKRAIEDIDWISEEDILRQILEQWLTDVEQTAMVSTSSLVGDIDWSTPNPFLPRLQNTLGHRIVGITDTTRGIVEETVRDALFEGTSMPDLADLLRDKLAPTYNGRAENVARTESKDAFGYASQMAFEESGLVPEVMIADNPSHTDAYGASDGHTCASRNGLVVPTNRGMHHVGADHPRGSACLIPMVAPLEG